MVGLLALHHALADSVCNAHIMTLDMMINACPALNSKCVYSKEGGQYLRNTQRVLLLVPLLHEKLRKARPVVDSAKQCRWQYISSYLAKIISSVVPSLACCPEISSLRQRPEPPEASTKRERRF